MLFLVLRIIITPLAVLVGTVAQRRLGESLGGVIVGLPLTTIPFLWLMTRQYGTGFTASMTSSLLVTATAEAVVLWTYARLSGRLSPTSAMIGSLSVFALVAGLLQLLHLHVLVAGLLAVAAFAGALRWWPSTSVAAHEPGRSRLALRLVVATAFTVAMITLAGRLGPSLSGIVDALPLLSLMMAFFTHQEVHADASARFLRGVTKGTFSYVATIWAVAELLHAHDVRLTFVAAILAAAAAQLVLQMTGGTRVLRRTLRIARPLVRRVLDTRFDPRDEWFDSPSSVANT